MVLSSTAWELHSMGICWLTYGTYLRTPQMSPLGASSWMHPMDYSAATMWSTPHDSAATQKLSCPRGIAPLDCAEKVLPSMWECPNGDLDGWSSAAGWFDSKLCTRSTHSLLSQSQSIVLVNTKYCALIHALNCWPSWAAN